MREEAKPVSHPTDSIAPTTTEKNTKKGEKEEGESTPQEDQGNYFERRHTYIHIKVSLSQALNPAIDSQILPRAKDIAR